MANMYRIRTVHTGVAGSPFYTNMFFASDGTLPTAQDCVNAVDTFWDGLNLRLTSAMTGVIGPGTTEIDAVTGQPVFVQPTTQAVQSYANTVEQLPHFTQGLIRWNTGVFNNGRQIIGHTFIPGFCEDHNTAIGTPTAAAIASMQNAADALIADSGNIMVVYSRVNASPAVVTSASVSGNWGILASRRQ